MWSTANIYLYKEKGRQVTTTINGNMSAMLQNEVN